MRSDCLARNHFQVTVRTSIGLFSESVKKIKQHRFEISSDNMNNIPYIRAVGAQFKCAVGGSREASP